MTATTTEPTITHPAWCDPKECHYEPDGGVHWSTSYSLALHTDEDPDDTTCEIRLSLSDDDAEPLVWLDVAACETVTLADLERFARWLADRAVAFRLAIANEDGAR